MPSTLTSGLVLAAGTVAAILLLDVPVARAVHRMWPARPPAIQTFTAILEQVFLFRLSIYAAGVVLLACALALTALGSRRWARLVTFVALSQLTTRFLVDILKPAFSRLRPFEALADGAFVDRFLAPVGNAFPSGHAAHFWGFYFALAVLLPKWRRVLAVLPLLASTSRVAVMDHYVGDVLGSAAIAALVTAGYATLLLPSATPVTTVGAAGR